VVELGRSGSEKMVKLRVRRRTQVSDSSCCEGALSMRITHQSLRYYDSTTLILNIITVTRGRYRRSQINFHGTI